MKRFKLIGIHGPLNSGKDTIANYILAMDKTISGPSRFKQYAFAKPIKEACKILFDYTDEQLEDRILKEEIDERWGFSPRKTFQLLGTEFGRSLKDDIWIKRAELEVTKNYENGFGTIITDVRFQNEADWIRSQPNSILIYIEAPNIIRDEKYNHSSEMGITRHKNDFIIINDKSKGINILYNQIDKIL